MVNDMDLCLIELQSVEEDGKIFEAELNCEFASILNEGVAESLEKFKKVRIDGLIK